MNSLKQNLLKINGLDFKTEPYKRPKIIKSFILTNLDDAKETYLTRISFKQKQHKSDIDIMVMINENGYDYVESHLQAWSFSVEYNQPVMIMSPGIEFNRKFTYSNIEEQFIDGIIGLNEPTRDRTRTEISRLGRGVHALVYTDKISEDPPLQGYFGNDLCYIIKPWAAKQLLEMENKPKLLSELFCHEKLAWLQTVYPFYTRKTII